MSVGDEGERVQSMKDNTEGHSLIQCYLISSLCKPSADRTVLIVRPSPRLEQPLARTWRLS